MIYYSTVSSAPTKNPDDNHDNHQQPADWGGVWSALASISNLAIAIASVTGVIFTYLQMRENNKRLGQKHTELDEKHNNLNDIVKKLKRDLEDIKVSGTPTNMLEDDLKSLVNIIDHGTPNEFANLLGQGGDETQV